METDQVDTLPNADTLIARLRDSAAIKSLDKWIRDEFEAAADALAKQRREIERLRADAMRLDWMEANLCRAGEVRDNAGRCVKLARTWAIMGELETLRDTIDAAIAAHPAATKQTAG